MTCEEYRALLDRLLDGEATPEELESMRAHEADCPDCAALRAEMEDLTGLLRDAEDVPPMPEDLHAQWVQAVREDNVREENIQEESAQEEKPVQKQRILSMAAFRKQWMRWGATAALALLVLGGTLLTWDSFDKAKTRTPKAQPPAVTATLAAAKETPEVQAEAIVQENAVPAEAVTLGANSVNMAMEEAFEVSEEEPMEEAYVLADTANADGGLGGAPMLSAMMAEESAPEEAWFWEEDAEDSAWDMDEAFEAETEYKASELQMPVPAATSMPTSTIMPTPTAMPTEEPTPSPIPQPTMTPTSEPTEEPVPTAEPEKVGEPEPEEEPEALSESRPRQWIGWISLAVGGALAVIVLATKQIRIRRNQQKR
ncbi:MAG: zf-HC2 domain-containing protein [Clostridia bacterium]|nr:zf-HC2 domain-containing protein [Clostridia bacterium]